MTVVRSSFLLYLTWLMLACSTTPAPVIDRLPAGKVTKTAPAIKNTHDWRPNQYTVKKGDTLYSIGLEYGYDYKEIAAANHIQAPYIIRVGQTLSFTALNETTITATNSPAQETENGVTTYPMSVDTTVVPVTTAPEAPPPVIAINEPKAIREPYSEEAYKTPLPAPKSLIVATSTKATASASAPSTPAKQLPAEQPATKPKAETQTKTEPNAAAKVAPPSAGQLNWAWPTAGKVISNFNDAGNKGVDIAGSMGQPIQAAESGKVIYSGSDLRGYGKLVIVKHNPTFLSVYANNSLILVKEGQQVSRGQKIAEMGNTDSNTVKLHFEIRQQGKSVDPMKFVTPN